MHGINYPNNLVASTQIMLFFKRLQFSPKKKEENFHSREIIVMEIDEESFGMFCF
jgi:hypothetical protein